MKNLVFVVPVLLMACVTTEGSFQSKGLSRAAFDLKCPAEKLETVVLVRNDGLGCAGSQVGVSGCDRQATYVCTRSQDWIMNSAGETSAKAE